MRVMCVLFKSCGVSFTLLQDMVRKRCRYVSITSGRIHPEPAKSGASIVILSEN